MTAGLVLFALVGWGLAAAAVLGCISLWHAAERAEDAAIEKTHEVAHLTGEVARLTSSAWTRERAYQALRDELAEADDARRVLEQLARDLDPTAGHACIH